MSVSFRQKIAIVLISILFSFPLSLFSQTDTLPSPLNTEVQTGYKSQKIRDISGSVSTITRADLNTIPSGNITNQFQGLASGLSVISNGQPGSAALVGIRGLGSFSQNEPLFVVDGMITHDIAFLNPNDIESVVILKDAGSAAIYGSMAMGGVVLLTTRKATQGIHLGYDMSMGLQLQGTGPSGSLLNTQQYADLQWLVYRNDGTNTINPVYGPSTNAQPTLPSWAANTDWYAAITRKAMMQNHFLSISGGGKHSNFYAGFGYLNQNGILIQNLDKRYTGRLNAEFTFLNDRIRIGEKFAVALQSNPAIGNLNDPNPIQAWLYGSQPIIPAYITTPITGLTRNFIVGEYGGTGISSGLGNSTNAVADLERGADNIRDNKYLNGNIYASINILDGLNLTSAYSISRRNMNSLTFKIKTYENSENSVYSYANDLTSNRNDYTWTNILSFNKTLNAHKISLLAGYETASFDKGSDQLTQRTGSFQNAAEYNQLLSTLQISGRNSGTSVPDKQVSQFFRANYSFKDKYLLEFIIRHDELSQNRLDSGKNIYPSASIAWRLSDESFMKNIGWLNEAKIRASYGKTGSIYNEINLTTNIGLDAEFFSRHIGLQLDWYTRDSKQVYFQPVLPGTGGNGSLPAVGTGSISNTGINLGISWRINHGDFGFNSSLILSTYKNKIDEIYPGVTFYSGGSTRIGSLSRNIVGSPLDLFYGYKVIGLFRDAADVSSSPRQDGAAPGFFKFANLDETSVDPLNNNRQVIDSKDRTIIGNPNPKFTYALNLNFTLKRFDLSAFFYGSEGNDIYNFNKWWTDFWPSFQGQKSTDLLYNSWTSSNTGAKVPKASNNSNFSTNTQSTSYYIEDGSYLRLKSLQLGYTLASGISSRIHIQSLRIYLQAVNLFTLTKYSGIDPEIGDSGLSYGIDSGTYPVAKQFIFGLQLRI
jgi:TonB-dependent starch-binding outer membrane protein SusC